MIDVQDQTLSKPWQDQNWLASIYVRDEFEEAIAILAKISLTQIKVGLQYYGIIQETQSSNGRFNDWCGNRGQVCCI